MLEQKTICININNMLEQKTISITIKQYVINRYEFSTLSDEYEQCQKTRIYVRGFHT